MTTALSRTHDVKTVHGYEDETAASALLSAILTDPDGAIDREALAEFGRPWGADFGYRRGGDLVLLTEDGTIVAGGAYRRYDSTTAQLGWLWTRPGRRRTGLAAHVLSQLEISAVWRGYERVYAVAGPGQREARGLLAANGYRPIGRRIFEYEYLAFAKPVEYVG